VRGVGTLRLEAAARREGRAAPVATSQAAWTLGGVIVDQLTLLHRFAHGADPRVGLTAFLKLARSGTHDMRPASVSYLVVVTITTWRP
jgi:hypothetical protein